MSSNKKIPRYESFINKLSVSNLESKKLILQDKLCIIHSQDSIKAKSNIAFIHVTYNNNCCFWMLYTSVKRHIFSLYVTNFLLRYIFFLLKAHKRKIDIVYPSDTVEWVDGNNMFRIYSYSNFANNMQRRLCLTETKKAYYLKWTQFSIGLSLWMKLPKYRYLRQDIDYIESINKSTNWQFFHKWIITF